MKKLFFTSIFMLFAALSMAQEAFVGLFYCEELKASLNINLVDNVISLPDLDFEDTYGYLKGNLNGTWVVLKVKKADKKKAVVRMISDMGNDAQDVEFTLTAEGNIEMRLLDEQNIKTIADRKYVKIPKVNVFVKN